MTSFQGFFYLQKQKEARWGHVGSVGWPRNRRNHDLGQVLAHDKAGVAGNIVMVKLPRVLDLTPDTVNPLF